MGSVVHVGRKGIMLLGRPRLKVDDNIKVGLQKIGCEGMHYVKVA